MFNYVLILLRNIFFGTLKKRLDRIMYVVNVKSIIFTSSKKQALRRMCAARLVNILKLAAVTIKQQ